MKHDRAHRFVVPLLLPLVLAACAPRGVGEAPPPLVAPQIPASEAVDGAGSAAASIASAQDAASPDALPPAPAEAVERNRGDRSHDRGPGIVLVDEEHDGFVHFGGVLEADLLDYGSDNVRDDGFEMGRAVLRLEGAVDPHWSYRVAGDLVGTDTRGGFEEAWVAWSEERPLRVRAGLLEMPLGFDSAFAEEDLPFGGYGFSSYADLQTDWGAGVDGELDDGLLTYEVLLGAGEGYDLLGNDRDSPRASGRLVAYPFRGTSEVRIADRRIPLDGAFIGFGAAWSPEFRGDFEVATPVENVLFRAEDLRADEARFYHWLFGWDAGPVRLAYEAVLGEVFDQWFGAGSGFFGVDTPGGGEVDLDQVGTWEAGISWMVTGGRYDSRPGRVREFGLPHGKEGPIATVEGHRGHGSSFPTPPWGALELYSRYSNADIDRGFFDAGLASYSYSSQEFRTATLGANWFPTPFHRLGVAVVRTIADQTPAAYGGDDRDTSLLVELEGRF